MRRLGLTVVCAWVWCLIVGCASSVGGTAVPAGRGSSAPPPPAKPTVAGAELPKLVLPLDEIKTS